MFNEETWVGVLELGGAPTLRGVLADDAARDGASRVLVRLHGRSLGFIDLQGRGGPALIDRVMSAAVGSFGRTLADHLEADTGSRPTEAALIDALLRTPDCAAQLDTVEWPGLSVVVCTRDRGAQLSRCLEALGRLRYDGAFELIIVDNAPSDDGARAMAEAFALSHPNVRYALEPKPGLSNARNRGVAVASHEIVCFSDDDVVVDPGWLTAIGRGFLADPETACVTGLVVAGRLKTEAERYFEERSRWSAKLTSTNFHLHLDGQSPLYPFNAAIFGTGANFAVRRTSLARVGGFDPILGAGGPVGGGEDLDVFLRLVLDGTTISYTPDAIVWHFHRETSADLKKQMRQWGAGLGGYLAKQLVQPTTRRAAIRRAPRGLLHMLNLWGRSGAGAANPKRRSGFAVSEMSGVLAGMSKYLRAHRRDRRSHRSVRTNGPASGHPGDS